MDFFMCLKDFVLKNKGVENVDKGLATTYNKKTCFLIDDEGGGKVVMV
jgi:hypothetical protein